MILIPTVASERASVKFVFTHFNTENGVGIHNKLYIFVVGLLMSQYSLIGYDASAHMVRPLFLSLVCTILLNLSSISLKTMFWDFFKSYFLLCSFYAYTFIIWFFKSYFRHACLTYV